VSFCLLFVCKCVLYYCHRVTTQLQLINISIYLCNVVGSRSHWPCCLRCGSTVARLLGQWVRIPPGAWMFVSFECSVLSGRGLCVGLIAHPEKFYRVCVCLNVIVKRQQRGFTRGCRAVGGNTSRAKNKHTWDFM